MEGELQNIEVVFIANGYSRREVQREMEKINRTQSEENEEEESMNRGIVSVPHIPSFTRTFNRIAQQHNFRTTTKAENKVRDITSKARTPLGEKNKNVAYNIPCGCKKTFIQWRSRQNVEDAEKLTQSQGETDTYRPG